MTVRGEVAACTAADAVALVHGEHRGVARMADTAPHSLVGCTARRIGEGPA